MSDQQNRRDFLFTPLGVVATSPLFARPTAASPSTGAKPIYRTLGKTGLSLPIVNMGVMNADVPGLIRRAYEVGMRHYDTAASYQNGRNEEMVGRMIKEIGVRNQVTVATKVHLRDDAVTSPETAASFRRVFEGSLRRLQMDHVDILFNHMADTVDRAHSQGIIEALTALKKGGKTRFTGISTHAGVPVINEVVKLGVYDVLLVVINYTLAGNHALLEAIDRAAKAGMGVIAMKTQAGGMTKPSPRLPKNLPPASQTALLKWVLRNESIATAIPGFTTYEQLEQCFSVASNLAYTDEEKAFLADKAFTAQAQFCRQCGQCRPDCPRRVDIPTLMRSHMYAVQYKNLDLATDTLASITPGRGLDACRDCASCPVACRGTVDIGTKIDRLKGMRLMEVPA
jgi:uncharacterized protein